MERVGGDHRSGLGHGPVVAHVDQGPQQLLLDPQLQLVEGHRFPVQLGEPPELRERRPAPQRERLGCSLEHGLRWELGELGRHPSGDRCVELVVAELEHVAGAPVRESSTCGTQLTADPRHVAVQRLSRVGGRVVRPEGVDEAIDTDHPTPRSGQRGKQGSPTGAGDAHVRPVYPQGQRTEDLDPHLRGRSRPESGLRPRRFRRHAPSSRSATSVRASV